MQEHQQGTARREPVVCVKYTDLQSGADLCSAIEQAYGNEGLGILAVTGVPNLQVLRAKLLPLAKTLAELPAEVQAELEHPSSSYMFGWSLGKERLSSGTPDFSKGSYYANPVYDRPVDDESQIAQFPASIHPNIWPTKHLPDLEPAFKVLGQLVIAVGVLVARQCDAYAARARPGYSGGLERMVAASRCAKGRLLHYFPLGEGRGSDNGGSAQRAATSPAAAPPPSPPLEGASFSDWCGWHLDHGSLTGLVPAMHLDARGAEVTCPDPASGLHVMSRRGELVRPVAPEGCLLFQVGEAAQVQSGGALRATPHAVRAISRSGSGGAAAVSRETFAVFMQPMCEEAMVAPEGGLRGEGGDEHLPRGVAPLHTRWEPGISFGEFVRRTMRAYYG
ncbi:hypothetical protein JKP88DRAFT_193064 [Tribonema minus]|uniref:Non-haem dioxygenase N-terminal domain-containing protein n=1 Tax=Tribonema minus TaxID=303371 RepID=A0A835Z9V9_9STRA|nr:hypothetical protein JKP88DRAFT_193064 [Tribonema minus]